MPMSSSLPPTYREAIEKIHRTFAEHRKLTYAEWVEGFVGEANLAKELGIWLHAADVYTKYAKSEADAARRKDIYRVIGACLIGARDFALAAIEHKLKPTTISPSEIKEIVEYYFREAN